jgi:hypothetical protein
MQAAFGGTFLLLLLATAVSWITNLVKFTDCDFAAPYKCEAIHAAGLIPPVALVTAWIGTDKP